jgi:hypothetical protein
MWILETGVCGRDNNFSVFSKLNLAAFVKKISRIEENRTTQFLNPKKAPAKIF